MDKVVAEVGFTETVDAVATSTAIEEDDNGSLDKRVAVCGRFCNNKPHCTTYCLR